MSSVAASASGAIGPLSRPLDMNCAVDSATSLDDCTALKGVAKRSPLDTNADILTESENTSQSRRLGPGRRWSRIEIASEDVTATVASVTTISCVTLMRVN